jgi:hypothetical protein
LAASFMPAPFLTPSFMLALLFMPAPGPRGS